MFCLFYRNKGVYGVNKLWVDLLAYPRVMRFMEVSMIGLHSSVLAYALMLCLYVESWVGIVFTLCSSVLFLSVGYGMLYLILRTYTCIKG